MKTKMICFAALLLTIFCSFAPVARANDGDWTPTYKAEWWWKYVYPQERQFPIYVDDIAIGPDSAISGGREIANALAYRLKNTGSATLGVSIMLVHTIRSANGSILSSEVIARAQLPAMRSGETVRLSGNAQTAISLRGQRHFIEVQMR